MYQHDNRPVRVDGVTKILVTGLVTLDLIFRLQHLPKFGEKYLATDGFLSGGGNAGNAAVAAARLGGEVSIFAAVGLDDVGALILKGFQQEGIDTTSVIQLEDHQSSFSSIVIENSGERQILNYRKTLGPENLEVLQKLPIKDGYLADSRWNEAAIATLKLADKFSKPGVLDAEAPVSYEAVSTASHVAFSRQGLCDFTQQDDLLSGLRSLSNRLNNWICVTDGSAGVYYLDQGEPRNILGPQVLAVDTLGAGDVWHGAFVLGLAEGKNELDSIHFANLAAALKCTNFGARAGMPTRSDVSDFNLSVIESE